MKYLQRKQERKKGGKLDEEKEKVKEPIDKNEAEIIQ